MSIDGDDGCGHPYFQASNYNEVLPRCLSGLITRVTTTVMVDINAQFWQKWLPSNGLSQLPTAPHPHDPQDPMASPRIHHAQVWTSRLASISPMKAPKVWPTTRSHQATGPNPGPGGMVFPGSMEPAMLLAVAICHNMLLVSIFLRIDRCFNHEWW